MCNYFISILTLFLFYSKIYLFENMLNKIFNTQATLISLDFSWILLKYFAEWSDVGWSLNEALRKILSIFFIYTAPGTCCLVVSKSYQSSFNCKLCTV